MSAADDLRISEGASSALLADRSASRATDAAASREIKNPRSGPAVADPVSPSKLTALAAEEGRVDAEVDWLSRKLKDPTVRRRAPFCLLACAGVAFLSVLVQIQIFRRFTPVYTQTECGNQTAALKKMSMGYSRIEIGMQIEVTCKNPNPYAIKILASTPGDVFIDPKGSELGRLRIGSLRVLRSSSLPEYGSGLVRVRMDTSIEGKDANLLLPHFLSDSAVPIMMELRFVVGVYLSFGLVGWSVSAPFSKACGLNVEGVLVNQFLPADNSGRSQRLGPLICRESFDGLRASLPPVGEKTQTPKDGNMGFSAAQVAPTEVAAGEFVKTASLGTTILSTSVFMCLFIMLALAIKAHPLDSPGLWDDLKVAPEASLSFRLLAGNAWNGVIDLGELAAAKMQLQLPPLTNYRVPRAQLTPPPPRSPDSVKAGPKDPGGGSWLRRLLIAAPGQVYAGCASAAAFLRANMPAKSGAFGYYRLATAAGAGGISPRQCAASGEGAEVRDLIGLSPSRVRGAAAGSADRFGFGDRGDTSEAGLAVIDELSSQRRRQSRARTSPQAASEPPAASRPDSRSSASDWPIDPPPSSSHDSRQSQDSRRGLRHLDEPPWLEGLSSEGPPSPAQRHKRDGRKHQTTRSGASSRHSSAEYTTSERSSTRPERSRPERSAASAAAASDEAGGPAALEKSSSSSEPVVLRERSELPRSTTFGDGQPVQPWGRAERRSTGSLYSRRESPL